MIIRKAVSADADALQKLYQILLPEDPVVESGIFRAALDEILAGEPNRLLIVEIDGEVVSTCYLNLIPNLTRNLRPYAIIENVVTNSAHRNKGYATAVLQAAMAMAEDAGCYKVMLQTGSKRESTLRFYEKAGLDPGKKTAFVTRFGQVP